ncbi:MipA/OmpV family protein, partial [Endozoicomonas sp.]|nr:MipA/OmpV family protein [Endozoicomonas sp.]
NSTSSFLMKTNHTYDGVLKPVITASFCTLALTTPSIANTAIPVDDKPAWGLGVSGRISHVPFDTYSDTSTNLVPELYYNGDYFFMEGSQGGLKLSKTEHWSVDFLGRMRFADLPRKTGEEYRMDTTDWGLRIRYQPTDKRRWFANAMSDLSHGNYLDIGHEWLLDSSNLTTKPYLYARIKDAGYNSYYYGGEHLGGKRLGGSIESSLGVDARYLIGKGTYLVAGLEYTYLDNEARQSPLINSHYKAAATLGVMFIGDAFPVTGNPRLPDGSYLRVAYGWATPSDMQQILTGKNDSKGFDDTLTSLFYGYPLKQNAFDLPIDFYLHAGLIWHHSSNTQPFIAEGVLSIKAYYTLHWPVTWRIGVAEGLSYVSRSTYLEKSELDRKERNENRLMNYLDISFDINLGDLIKSRSLNSVWLGYGMHHRSAVFEKSSQFGRIKGGSNYNTVYLQFDF